MRGVCRRIALWRSAEAAEEVKEGPKGRPKEERMRNRFFASFIDGCALSGLHSLRSLGIAILAVVPVAIPGQAPKAAPKAWTAPKSRLR